MYEEQQMPKENPLALMGPEWTVLSSTRRDTAFTPHLEWEAVRTWMGWDGMGCKLCSQAWQSISIPIQPSFPEDMKTPF